MTTPLPSWEKVQESMFGKPAIIHQMEQAVATTTNHQTTSPPFYRW